MAFVMELRSNYHGRRVLNSYVGRKLVTNYRNVTKLLRDESTLPWYYPRCSNPTTDRRRRRTLIMKERYEIILDDSKRDDRKRKCLHNSTTKLEGMPTLRMF